MAPDWEYARSVMLQRRLELARSVMLCLQSELMALMASGDAGVSAFPDGDSLFSWLGTIQGAAGTVYEGLSYKLSLKFPSGVEQNRCFEH